MPTPITIKLKLPFFEISGNWEPDESERRAAWELYVELVTRVPVAPLASAEGILREALDSMYSVFGTTRGILKTYGPDIAGDRPDGQISFGYIAVALLNGALRPFLTKWHPRLEGHQSSKPQGVPTSDHEANWSEADNFRRELAALRETLLETAQILGVATNAPDLLRAVEPEVTRQSGM